MLLNSIAKFLFFAFRSSGSVRLKTEGTKNAMETTSTPSTTPLERGGGVGGGAPLAYYHRAAVMQHYCKYILRLSRGI